MYTSHKQWQKSTDSAPRTLPLKIGRTHVATTVLIIDVHTYVPDVKLFIWK